MKKILGCLWKGLEQKGRIGTLLGLLLVLPVNINFQLDFFRGIMWGNPALTALGVINGIGIVWFILPSRLSLKGPKVELIVED